MSFGSISFGAIKMIVFLVFHALLLYIHLEAGKDDWAQREPIVSLLTGQGFELVLPYGEALRWDRNMDGSSQDRDSTPVGWVPSLLGSRGTKRSYIIWWSLFAVCFPFPSIQLCSWTVPELKGSYWRSVLAHVLKTFSSNALWRAWKRTETKSGLEEKVLKVRVWIESREKG